MVINMIYMNCNICNFKLKNRIYSANITDDNNNLYCVNINCNNYTNYAVFNNVKYTIKYSCKKCCRTLVSNNQSMFGDDYTIESLLYLEDYNIDFCNICASNMIKLLDCKECDICGIVSENNSCEWCHNSIINNNITENEFSGNRSFIKNKNNEKCKHCGKYLMKCNICDNSCYVCVYKDCSKSLLTGNELHYYSYLCKNHAVVATNRWTRNNYHSTSGIVCDNCGVNKANYKPKCSCSGKEYVPCCINCKTTDASMLFCYSCY